MLIGATTVGPAGGEMIGALSVAVHAEVPVPTLLSTIWAYPRSTAASGTRSGP